MSLSLIISTFIIIAVTMITIIFVYVYNTYYHKYFAFDVLNTQLLKINSIHLKICLWNILHIIYFYGLCDILKPKNSYHYLFIIIFMFLWMFVESLVYYMIKPKIGIVKNKDCTELCYCNPYVFRWDDLIFNLIGVGLWVWIRRI